MKNGLQSHQKNQIDVDVLLFLTCFLQNALNAQRVATLVKTAETMGILDTYSDGAKQADIDEILGFLASLEKVIL